MLTSFILITANCIKIAMLIFINFIINVLMCFIFYIHFSFFLLDNLINCMLDNIIFSLLFPKKGTS